MTSRPIKIIDKPCGSGKTTAMINNFNNNEKYLVIVPLLSEVDRIVESSKEVEFVQPEETDTKEGTKCASLKEHILNGRNVVSTHQLYEYLVPLAKAGLLNDYHIIIDEVPNVVKEKRKKSQTSIQNFYVKTGYMIVDESSGLVKPTQKWIDTKDVVSDTLSLDILLSAMTDCLYLQDNKVFLRVMPRCLLEVGLSFTVMTYKAEGSMFVAYLRKLGIPFIVDCNDELEKEFRLQASNLITVEDISSISKSSDPEINLSFRGQTKSMKNKKACATITHSLKNLRGRKLNGIAASQILLTCMKDAWKKKAANDNEYKPGVFAKNSRLWNANWIPNTTKGTNDYAHCSHLIYLYDQYPNPYITRWLGDSSTQFKEAYALSELIQWVWRSRVRKGEPITVYMASTRMRVLFENWLNLELSTPSSKNN